MNQTFESFKNKAYENVKSFAYNMSVKDVALLHNTSERLIVAKLKKGIRQERLNNRHLSEPLAAQIALDRIAKQESITAFLKVDIEPEFMDKLHRIYDDVVDLRNRISLDGDDVIYEEDHLLLDEVLDAMESLMGHEMTEGYRTESEEGLKTFYILDLDGYGQPSGVVQNIELTEEEFEEIKRTRGYIYRNYEDAMDRALD